MKRNFLPWMLLLTALTLAAGGCGREATQSAPAAPAVGVYAIVSEPVTLVSELPGRTTAYRVAEVRPQVSGIVLKRVFEEGALVKEGEELYQIDPDTYKAAYSKATAHMENTERLAKRRESLKDKASISAQDYEDALFAWEQAKADAELARLNLAYCRIKAPLSGKIGRSSITEGALVTNGQAQAMAVINQIDPIFVDLNPAMIQILKNQRAFTDEESHDFFQGANVKLILEDGLEYPFMGQIKFLDNSVDQGTGTVTLRAEFPNPDGKLLPGMFVRALIQEGVKPDGKMLPQQALVRDMKGRPQVWVVRPDNTVEKRDVEAERTVGNAWLVTKGLEQGELVVTEGLQRLRPGLEVTPQKASNVQIRLAFENSGQAAPNSTL